METKAPPIRQGDSILRLPEVERRTGLRRSTIYRRARAGEFPKPVRVGPTTSGWLESEIDAFLAAAVAARDAQEQPA